MYTIFLSTCVAVCRTGTDRPVNARDERQRATEASGSAAGAEVHGTAWPSNAAYCVVAGRSRAGRSCQQSPHHVIVTVNALTVKQWTVYHIRWIDQLINIKNIQSINQSIILRWVRRICGKKICGFGQLRYRLCFYNDVGPTMIFSQTWLYVCKDVVCSPIFH